jgi:hypothetical protein
MYSVYLVREYSHYLRFTLRLALKVLKILRFTWEDSTQQLIGRVSETWRWKPALKGLHWVRLEMWRQGVPGGARLLRLPRFSPTSRFQTVFFEILEISTFRRELFWSVRDVVAWSGDFGSTCWRSWRAASSAHVVRERGLDLTDIISLTLKNLD